MVPRPTLLIAVLGVVAVVAVAVVTAGSAAGASPPVASSSKVDDAGLKARAGQAATAVVGDRPAALHAGPDDRFVQQPIVSSLGWQYVPYERTYRGLPVIGGDFVVVVDPAGELSSTSVALKQPIKGVGTAAKVTRVAAEKVASGRLKSVSKVQGSRLVVYALGASPRLAWESVVAGRGTDGPSVLTVDVDAVDGTVLHTKENVAHDVGHAGLNGGLVNVPDALINCPTGNCPDQHTWILAYPSGGGLSCDAPTVHKTDPEPLEWGDGDPTHAETACVDAMFVSATENAMLSNWLGRNGLDGAGANNGFPIFTDSSIGNNAYYLFPGSPFEQPEVHIGRAPNGVWLASLDTVGHENGHGIDDHTPSGQSGGGTSEFIADAFGLATEWYANGHAPYDTPDYVYRDTAALASSTGLKRFFYQPSLDGHSVSCYRSDIATTVEVHDAAGVGNHWLYLLAEGSNPADGQPASPTCNGSVLGGVGLQTAMKILYNAMLMKNSNSSYLTYRTWTLTAAKNLTPGDCTAFYRTKAAWDAVNVPAQADDPTCPIIISLVPAFNRAVGAPFSIQLSATGGVHPYTWSVTGLPPGVSLNPSTGMLSGVTNQPGSFTVTYTATDTYGNSTASSFTVLVKIPAVSGARIAATPSGLGWLPVFGTRSSDDGVFQYLPGLPGWYQFDGALRTIAAETNADGRMEQFGVTSAGTIFHRAQMTADISTALGRWGPWSQLDGALSSIAAARNSDGRIELFGSDELGHVWHRSQTAANASCCWTPWVLFDGPGMVKVAAEANLDGRVELFGLDGVGHIFHRAQLVAGGATGWEAWTQRQGTLDTIAVARNANGVLEMFGTHLSAVYHSAQGGPGSGSWTAWQQFDGGGLVDIGAVGEGNIELVGIDSSGVVYYRYQLGGTWAGSSWVPLGPMTPATVTVPNVEGRTQSSAITTLTNTGLAIGTISSTTTKDQLLSGKVITQTPAPGTAVPAGTAVNLSIGVWDGSRL